MTREPDCLFCRMVSGDVPTDVIADNEFAFAIRDIHPRAPVHALIIPKTHIPTAADLGTADGVVLGGLFSLAAKVAAIEKVDAAGYRLAFNVGEAAGMTIWHLHLHLVGGRRLGPEG